MFDEVMRILFNILTDLRPVSLKPDFPPIIAFMSCLSSSVKKGNFKKVWLRAKSTKTYLNLLVPSPMKSLYAASLTS